MSSILEALRELEGRRQPTRPPVAAPAEQPSTVNRAAETIGIVCIGLVIGALAFLLIIWLSGLVRGPERGVEKPAASGAAPGAPSAAHPAWLENADPPRARIAPAAAARSAPDARGGGAAPRRVEVASIDYSPEANRRAVTLRLDGNVITLREGESAGGVEVQLIEAEGVYVRRGAEVLMLSPGH